MDDGLSGRGKDLRKGRRLSDAETALGYAFMAGETGGGAGRDLTLRAP